MGPEQPERRGYDLMVQALSGTMSVTGEADGPPVKVGVPISDLAAALYSALAVAAQLFARQRTGRSARLDVSLYDSVLSLLANQSMNWLLCGVDTLRMGSDHPIITPYGQFRTKDADLIVAVGSDLQFEQLCEALGAPDLALDPRFRHNGDRIAHRPELKSEIEATTRGYTLQECQDRLDAVRVANDH
jgi:crotonobetainyl-CoA:carnitine CoA-transferase CaiB-like acyl-CoA transferase